MFGKLLIAVISAAWLLFPCGFSFGKTKTVAVKVHVDSQQSGYEGANAMDGNPNSMWHTQFSGDAGPGHPHQIVVDLGGVYPIVGFSYLPRSGGGNGTIKDYEFYVSDSDKDLGRPIAKGTFGRSQSANTVRLKHPAKGRYVVLRALSEVAGKPWTSIAGLEIFSEGVEFKTKTSRAARTGRGKQVAAVRKVQGANRGTPAGAMEFCRQTLDFVEQSAPRPQLAAELKGLAKKIEQAGEQAGQDALLAEARTLRRKIILSHPTLDFQRLLINKRPPPGFSHQSDQYLGRHSGLGDGLVILDDWKTAPKETVLLAGKLPPGSMLHPDLSFDGKKILFSYCDHTEANKALRRFFIYETNVDGSGLRQITGTAADSLEGWEGRESVLIEDWDPCYLPDGGIAFISTRNQGGVRCHHGGRYCPTYTLYRCEKDGSDIRPMVYGEANEWDPSVMHDGRIIWTRWDYINRHDTIYQSLWTLRPDGTNTAHFYGNYTRNPCSIAEARAIPGSHKIVATATAHHSYTAGSVIVIDPHVGQEGPGPIERVTPEIPFPETEGWGSNATATPWPLSEDLFLVAYSTERHARQGRRNSGNAYAIYLADTLGGRELVYRDDAISCFAPIPLRSRLMPPVLPSMVAETRARKTGTFYVQNVHQCTEPIPPGAVKKLRVIHMFPQTAQRVPDRSYVLFETGKKVLGTVPVEADGSVAFRAPAEKPLMFQLLDENEMAVMSMRTFVYLQPGESITCVGCHEPRNSSPVPLLMPSDIKFRELTPPDGPQYDGGLSFVRTVQPVLDRYCIRCHGLEKTEGNVNLLGTMDPGPVKLGRVRANTAYRSLTGRSGLVSVAHRNRETAYSIPKDYFAHAGRLGRILLEGDKNHAPAGAPEGLDRESFRRIVRWLDLNGEFYGEYSWNKPEWREVSAEGEKALRDHIRKKFGAQLAEQPYAALVNIGMPELSRILKAPLAREAGGWGQIQPGWKSTGEPGYKEMRALLEASILPQQFQDITGTSNRPDDPCRSNWVRKARADYKRAVASKQETAAGGP